MSPFSLLRFTALFLLIPFSLSPVFSAETLSPDFRVERFSRCEDLSARMIDIVEQYQDRYWSPYYRGSSLFDSLQALPSVGTMSMEKTTSVSLGGGGPFSQTNTQVRGVDESDIVKTDGDYIYTYSRLKSEVRIVKMSDMTLQKILTLPNSYWNVELYLAGEKLIVIGERYRNSGDYYSYQWYSPETKTTVAVYSVHDRKNPTLERYAEIDGSYRESRLIGSTLYFVSVNDFRLPAYYYNTFVQKKDGFSLAMKDIEKNFRLSSVVPKIRENKLSRTGRYAQSITSSVANCSDLTLVLPSAASMKSQIFSPTFASLSSLDVSSPSSKIQTSLLFGDVSQIHMSKKSLYITSTATSISRQTPCSDGLRCLFSPTSQIQSTFVHKYTIDGGKMRYSFTTKVEGAPLSQYSLDEDAAENLRIVTQKYDWSNGKNNTTTALSVLDTKGTLIGTLSGLAPGENFQSARFMGNRLYLVTFEQIDPLFVIDISTPKSPKVLGELKIPGYSTYLHPYDADRVIGLGYDTMKNQWGGTQNAGIKVDLYNVSDVKNPKQEATLTLGDIGSSSDVLSNPRAFVWYKEKNLLLLPATLVKSAQDKDDIYRSQSTFQGVVGVSIEPNSLKEKFRISHISSTPELEQKWKDECAKYAKAATTKSCHTLLDGSSYCENSYTYVPPYCYSGSTVETYIGNQLWNYSSDFIERVVYRGDILYTLSQGAIKSWDITSPSSPKNTLSFNLPDKNWYVPVAKFMK